MAASVSDDQPSSREQNAAANYAFARTLSVGLNALVAGLIATAFFAVALLWLQKSSGIALEKATYGSALLFILLLVTLCAYLVFDYMQRRKEEAAARRRRAAKSSAKRDTKLNPDDWGAILEARLKEFDPLFKENEQAAAEMTAPPSQPTAEMLSPTPPSTPTPPAVAMSIGAVKQGAAPKDPTAALFTQSITASIAGMEEEPSPFLYFGINLFLAGASANLASRTNLAPSQGKAVLEGMLLDIGISKRAAASFAMSANTFAQIPHFRGPIEAGMRAMAHFTQSGYADGAALPEALALWRMQEEICKPPELITFVTTSVGVPPAGVVVPAEDQQRVLRTHSNVITEILHRFQGREIHNLGNGRILMFDDATRAIRAATQCMEALDKFARSNPNLIVAPRIGVDTDLAAVVAHDYVSAALPRTVTIASIAPVGGIYCTVAAQEDTADVIEFQPVSLGDMYPDLPPLVSAAWTAAPVEVSNANPLEYRQVGALAD